MSREWKRQAAAAIAALVLICAAATVRSAAVFAQYMPKAAAEEAKQPHQIHWATITQTAATHDGPGLRYAITGTITAGHAVEVVRQMDGWCKCLTYLSEEPVWICGEYMVLSD